MQTTKRHRRRRAIVPSFSGVWEVQQPEEEEEAAAAAEEKEVNAVLSMSLADWLLLIPDYDGCPARLEAFAAATRYVASRLGPSSERTLLLALGSKLRGFARTSFGYRLHRHASLEQLLAGLRSHFAGRGCETELLEELGCARQYADERLWEFGARLDRLVSQLCCIYEEERDHDFVKDVALASFRRGLHNPELETRLGACEPKNLEEAIGLAIALDNELRYRDKLLKQMCQSSSTTKKRRYR